MALKENNVTKLIRLAWSAESRGILFRNNVGKAWAGRAKILTEKGKKTAIVSNPSRLTAGLCKGSSDIVGVSTIKITPEMVGKTIGVITCLEVKTGNLGSTKEQKDFISAIRKKGGIAGVVRSVEDAFGVVENWVRSIEDTTEQTE